MCAAYHPIDGRSSGRAVTAHRREELGLLPSRIAAGIRSSSRNDGASRKNGKGGKRLAPSNITVGGMLSFSRLGSVVMIPYANCL